ncbi:Asp-tRNA(Asn)/Glu-tRNA(Gln) amidotransferase subunit GatC [Deinococcus sp.]|uniref:Asp-tRNA(Asn)/Glu-tRNA(Gln) amidotransferase subunit GatC n=1 Tax=Deinococcus sp. TaxID=47478 RepID=UPI003CC56BC9
MPDADHASSRIDAAEVQHLAQLARLELSAAEQSALLDDLNKMLGYFEKLQELGTEGVPEMQRPVALLNVLRPDVAGEMFTQEQALALAPESQDGFVRVPRTVEP